MTSAVLSVNSQNFLMEDDEKAREFSSSKTVSETVSTFSPLYNRAANPGIIVHAEGVDDEGGLSEDEYHDAVSQSSSPVKLSLDGEDGLDSASKKERPPKLLTPEQIGDRVLGLINFYFGDDNYSKDQFLRKQAALDLTGEGWISVDVICSFKKMRKLTEDKQVVLAAARKSSLVALSADDTKIHRRIPLAKDVEVRYLHCICCMCEVASKCLTPFAYVKPHHLIFFIF